MDLVAGSDDGSRQVLDALSLLGSWFVGASGLNLEGLESVHCQCVYTAFSVPWCWEIVVISELDSNYGIIEKCSNSKLCGDVSWGVADSLEGSTGLNIWSGEESVSSPSVLVDTVDNHCLVVELGESNGEPLQSGSVLHHTSFYWESEYAVLLDGLVGVEVTAVVLGESC